MAAGRALAPHPLNRTYSRFWLKHLTELKRRRAQVSGILLLLLLLPPAAVQAQFPISTNTLKGGGGYFSDPDWTNYPARFYRIRSP